MGYSSCLSLTRQKAHTTLTFGITVACVFSSIQDGKFQPEHIKVENEVMQSLIGKKHLHSISRE